MNSDLSPHELLAIRDVLVAELVNVALIQGLLPLAANHDLKNSLEQALRSGQHRVGRLRDLANAQ